MGQELLIYSENMYFCDEDFNEGSAYPKEDYDAIVKSYYRDIII